MKKINIIFIFIVLSGFMLIACKKHEHIIEMDEAIPATCSSIGLTGGSHCSICNEIVEKQEVILKKRTYN